MENYFEWWSLIITMEDGLHAANQIRQNSQANSGIIVMTPRHSRR
jgi:hypothetical protein